MKIYLSQQIIPTDTPISERDSNFNIQKVVNWDVIPRKGDEIVDALYDDSDGCAVERVAFNANDDTCVVFIAPTRITRTQINNIPDLCDEATKLGWECF